MKTSYKLILVLVAAFLVRLIALNQSLWLDEGVTAKVVTMFPLFDIIPKFSVTDFHPPLFYIVMKLWTDVFGLSVISLRMPSILFTLLTGYFIFRIGKHIKNDSIGLWATVFFLFNPLIVYYSQETRMYMMATFFLTTSFYYFLLILKNKQRDIRELYYFNSAVFLAFLTFYGSAFFIVTLYGYFVCKRDWKKLLYILPGFGFALLLVLPLLQLQYQNSKEALGLVVNWGTVLGQANIKNLVLIPIKFAFGRISFEPKKVYYLLSFVWSLFVFVLAAKGVKKHGKLGYFFIMPIVFGILFSFLSPLLQYFRFLYLIPVLSILLALGSHFSNKLFTRIARTFLLTGFIILTFVYLLIPQFHREDWKSLAQELSHADDVYLIPSVSDALSYYEPAVQIKDIRVPPEKNNQQLILIPYVVDLYGYDYRKEYEQKGFTLYKSYTVRGIPYEIWK